MGLGGFLLMRRGVWFAKGEDGLWLRLLGLVSGLGFLLPVFVCLEIGSGWVHILDWDA